MGILEIHFHDSEFSWSVNPGTDKERSLSFETGSRSETANPSRSERSSTRPKLRSFAVLALVVAGGVAFNRMRSRRARGRDEDESGGRRLSLSRSK